MTTPLPKTPISNRERLQALAQKALRDRGLAVDFSQAALAQTAALQAAGATPGLPDLRDRLWCSIDNDDSRDLDQLSVAEERPGGAVRFLVAVADVDGLVARDTPLDAHAQANTTSIYTAGGIFPMLPEKLSTDLTSLGPGVDRDVLVFDYTVDAQGQSTAESLWYARVRNQAKLAYPSVSAWLESKGPLPAAAAAVKGMDDQLRLQDRAAQTLRQRRHDNGALDLETLQTRAVFEGQTVKALATEQHDRASQLIEELMIGANGVAARFLTARAIPSFRRVVRTPKHWDGLVRFAAGFHTQLPAQPDSGALERFLTERRQQDPLRFPDVSLAVVKLLGAGEYVVEQPGQPSPGHFGLAVSSYTHSTAPNRRFPDLLVHRQIKAALRNQPQPYAPEALVALATHCTKQEDAADKAERQVRKSAAALLLESRVGAHFDALVTGASDKGTWVRCLNPPVEGRVVRGEAGLRVGESVRVRLLGVNVDHGFIDFVRE